MTDERLTHIREALADGADDLTRQRGVKACRNILTALGAKPGQPFEVTEGAPASQPSPLINAARMAAGAPPRVILDAVIAKLKAHLPRENFGAESRSQPAVLRIPFIPVPRLGGGA